MLKLGKYFYRKGWVMKLMKIMVVGGARPNFMKIAPIYWASLNHNQIDCRNIWERDP